MTKDLFTMQMKRLVSVYGEKAYPQERADLIWGEFKHDLDWLFTEIVSNLISEYKTTPVLSDFRIERSKISQRQAMRNTKQSPPAENLDCEYISFEEYRRRVIKRNDLAELKDLIKLEALMGRF